MTDTEAAAIVGSTRTLQRIEAGESTGVTFANIGRLCKYYGVPREQRYEIERQWRMVKEQQWSVDAVLKAGFETYLDFEQFAVGIDLYETVYITGLLQTEAYMRRLFSRNPLLSPEQVEKLVALHLERQKRFWNRSLPPTVRVIMTEGVLLNGCDNEQFERLLEADSRRNVSISYLAYADGPFPMLSSAFSVLSFDDDDDPAIVYANGVHESRYYEDRLSVDRHRAVVNWADDHARSVKEFNR